MLGNVAATAKPRRLMTGRYLARNPAVVSAMALMDVASAAFSAREAPLPTDRQLNVLVSDLAHLGDVVALSPVLASLRASPRVGRIGLLVGSWSRVVADAADLADDVFVFDHALLNRGKKRFAAHFASRFRAVREIREARYDVAVDAYPYLGNASGLLWQAAIPTRIGFKSGGASGFYTLRVGFDPKEPLLTNQARLIAPIVGPSEGLKAQLPGFRTDEKVRARVVALGRFVVLHVGPGAAHKDWVASHWLALARRLEQAGFRLAYTGGQGDVEHGAAIRSAAPGEDFVGKLDFSGFATVLREAAGVVTIDTVTGHLAACFETPTAVIYPGIAPPSFWRPAQPFVRLVTEWTPCAPCQRTRGCAEMTCLRSVQSETVFAALSRAMEEKAATIQLYRGQGIE